MKKVIVKPKAAADIEAYKRRNAVELEHRPTNYTPPKKKRKKKGRKK